MCGIIAYLGNDNSIPYIINGLKSLQNRGYDSAGLTVFDSNKYFTTIKFSSTNNYNAISLLEHRINSKTYHSNIGIGHTRWATHGEKNDTNAHPHSDNKKRISIVHNGIIENYQEIRSLLIDSKYVLHSQTDTEVISVLIGKFLDENNSIEESIKKTLVLLKGTWALCIVYLKEPNKIWLTRNGSPLLLGMESNFIMVASETVAFGNHIHNYISIDNNDLIQISIKDNIINYATNIQRYQVSINDNKENPILPEKYSHWMIKEIHEQPSAIERALNNGGRISSNTTVKLGGLDTLKTELTNIDHIIILGCGTSYNAGLWSTALFKQFDIFETVSCIDGAEFTVEDIPKKNKTALILLSQSGETKDLHRCIDIAKNYDLITIGVVNSNDSMIARETDCGVYLNAGRENAVASTKSFSSQCVVLSMISVWFSQNKDNHIKKRQLCIKDLRNLPFHIQNTIDNLDKNIQDIIPCFSSHDSLFVLGKASNEAIAKEGALKIKEVSYKHAEGYSTSALKHGPFALITENLPIILIDTIQKYREKTINAYNEIKSRKGKVIVITDSPNDYKSLNIPDKYMLKIDNNYTFGGIIANVYMQFLSYRLAIHFGFNPDYPRNLAKVVTVE